MLRASVAASARLVAAATALPSSRALALRCVTTTSFARGDVGGNSGKLNPFYKPYAFHMPEAKAGSTVADATIDPKEVLARDAARTFDEAEIGKVMRENTLFTWGASDPYSRNALMVERGEGVYFYTMDGKQYLDFNSGAMCVNLGHTVPDSVQAAVAEQLDRLAYVYPCVAMTKVKAQLSALLADIMPGDLNHMYYTCGGADSNETALRMARNFTGRPKVLSRYRSYHGGTSATLSSTGDFRRWAIAEQAGNVHFMDPYPYHMTWGASNEEITRKNLEYLDETIQMEGPGTIAAIIMEAMTGTNGVLRPPPGYLNGVRALCDKYGILLICDEVMGGFGRTGKMFAFEHSSPAIVPDIVTAAKGINSAYLPLGLVAVRDHVAEYFKTHPVGIGSTYAAHPVSLASAYAVLKHSLEIDLLGNVQAMEAVHQREADLLAAKHPCVKQIRITGLFGIVELQQDLEGEPFARYAQGSPMQDTLRESMYEHGVYSLIRFASFFVNPPLTITEAELVDGWNRIDRVLTDMDVALSLD